MTQLNPYVPQSKKKIKTYLIPFNTEYKSYIESNIFKTFLLNDGTTAEGRNAIAKHYGVLSEWTSSTHKEDFLTQYYNLLLLVKTKSTKDNVWFSFVEGLHRHAAIVLSLLCSKFDYDKKALIPKSLDVNTFAAAGITNLRNNDTNIPESPEYMLQQISSNDERMCMLKSPFHVTAVFPSQEECNISTLTDVLTLKSASYSNNKLNSACKTISTKIAEVLQDSLNNSTPKQRRSKTQPIFTGNDMEYQQNIAKKKFKDLMIANNNNDSFLGYPKTLQNPEWINYINNPFDNEILKQFNNIIVVANSNKNKKQLQPPYGLFWDNLTSNPTYTKSKKTIRSIDSSHVNGYFITPLLVHTLVDKLQPTEKLLVTNNTKMNMIHALTRVAYGMKKNPSVQLHPAVYHYCTEANETEYTQALVGIHIVIPVTVFLVTLYNASFMFDVNKSRNLLVSALKRFDLGSTVGDNTFMNTMSKCICFFAHVFTRQFQNYKIALNITCFYFFLLFCLCHSIQMDYLGIFKMHHKSYQQELSKNLSSQQIVEKC